MPELPEVETARRGIEPHLIGQRIARVVVRQRQLRWPVPAALVKALPGQTIRAVERRAKYILIKTDAGTVLLHLGMSGSLRVLPCRTPPQKADHVDIALANGQCLRLRDPRRFGSLLWTTADPARHKLLKHLGPEPLGPEFDWRLSFCGGARPQAGGARLSDEHARARRCWQHLRQRMPVSRRHSSAARRRAYHARALPASG